MKLIDKDAVLAEINKRMSRVCGDDFYAEVKKGLYRSLIIYLNSLEEKEVDLDKPFEGVKVQTSMESGSLDEVIVTTKYKAQKGESV